MSLFTNNPFSGVNVSGTSFLKPNEEREFVIRHAIEKPRPSKEKLEEIERNILNATLVITIGEKEIKRLNLKDAIVQ